MDANNAQGKSRYCRIVPAKISGTVNTVLCIEPENACIRKGDRVLIATIPPNGGMLPKLDAETLADTVLFSENELEILKLSCPEQFPLRRIVARYNIESFDLPDQFKEV